MSAPDNIAAILSEPHIKRLIADGGSSFIEVEPLKFYRARRQNGETVISRRSA